MARGLLSRRMRSCAVSSMSGGASLRVCVTGAAGFLGTHLLRALQHALPGAELVGIDRRAPEPPLPGVAYADTFTGGDIVFHLAGGGCVETSWRDPRADLLLNAGST
ncbi:MAG: NAD-dependent epimerase/dehydratase family protein, partial [Polyangiaceae bacterium]|nr:NAD-dependent epimerase/dehydratase family protein [Polyangiaceae bacterium]